MSKDCEKYLRVASDGGASEGKLIDVKHVIVAEWVGMKCYYGCDEYGVGRLCPPRVPSVDEMRKVVSCYSRGLIFTFEGGSGKRAVLKTTREQGTRLPIGTGDVSGLLRPCLR
jgi:predicted metal-binding protein